MELRKLLVAGFLLLVGCSAINEVELRAGNELFDRTMEGVKYTCVEKGQTLVVGSNRKETVRLAKQLSPLLTRYQWKGDTLECKCNPKFVE